ncbi:MAG: hypothetical protein O3A51_09665 [Verrucomicrobia bacterium]|nr:hypothetical protein [Verrucomicrobiota bacterium]
MPADQQTAVNHHIGANRRVRAGRLLLLTVPLILVVMAEMGCRMAGYGGFAPAIREIAPMKDGLLCEVDWHGADSYFLRRRVGRGSSHQQTFVMPKPDNTIRIFLVGGSAIKGFPQPLPLTAGAMLQVLLADAWPGRQVEVLNMGTTAIASFPAMEMARACLDYDPDLIIFYAGHNEFYGAYGVASQHYAGAHTAMMRWTRRLHGSALVQWMVARLPRQEADGDTLMTVMMRDGSISSNSRLRRRAAANLKAHARSVVDRARRRNVPVMLCSLAGNERDIEPIGTTDPAHPSRQNFTLATNATLAGSLILAQRAYQGAIDADPQPWRATSSQQQALAEAAVETGAWFCDVAAGFRAAAPGGSVGWELMDDHVHPSLRGQFELARLLAQRLTGVEGHLQVAAAAVPTSDEWGAYARRLGANRYEELASAMTILALFRGATFVKSNSNALLRADARVRSLAAGIPDMIVAELSDQLRLEARHGGSSPVSGLAGLALMQAGAYAEAERLFDFACRSLPLYSSGRRQYAAYLYAARQQRQGGLSVTDREDIQVEIDRGLFLIEHGNTSNGRAAYAVGKLYGLLGEEEKSRFYMEQGLAQRNDP